MHAAATWAPLPAQPRRTCTASRASGVSRACRNACGVLWPIAVTIPQSGAARRSTDLTGTDNPCEVRTRRRTLTTLTSKRSDRKPYACARSLAVAKASSTAASPVSKTPLSARTSIFMAKMISKMSFLAMPSETSGAYPTWDRPSWASANTGDAHDQACSAGANEKPIFPCGPLNGPMRACVGLYSFIACASKGSWPVGRLQPHR
jgi:hypothetical protein